jgi:hypothetical protein
MFTMTNLLNRNEITNKHIFLIKDCIGFWNEVFIGDLEELKDKKSLTDPNIDTLLKWGFLSLQESTIYTFDWEIDSKIIEGFPDSEIYYRLDSLILEHFPNDIKVNLFNDKGEISVIPIEEFERKFENNTYVIIKNPITKDCICDSYDIFWFGCKCGGK